MTIHNRKLKVTNLVIDGTSFEGQAKTVTLSNNTKDGDKLYAFDGSEIREETDPDFALELEFYADWRAGGISDFLWNHDGERLAWSADHHPTVVGEHVRWSGYLTAKAPSVGGEARNTEMSKITLPVEGEPTYARVG